MSGCPSGKIRYRDELGAMIALSRTHARAAHERHQREKRREVRPYRCRRCRGWHLTSELVYAPRETT